MIDKIKLSELQYCEYCNYKQITVKLRPDPYALEIFEDETLHALCDGCYIKLSKDIDKNMKRQVKKKGKAVDRKHYAKKEIELIDINIHYQDERIKQMVRDTKAARGYMRTYKRIRENIIRDAPKGTLEELQAEYDKRLKIIKANGPNKKVSRTVSKADT